MRPPPPMTVGTAETVTPGVGVSVAAAVPVCGWPGAALAFGSGVAEAVPLGVTVIVGVLVMVAVGVRVGLRVAVITGTGEGAKLAASESQPDNSAHSSAAANHCLVDGASRISERMHAQSNRPAC